MFCTTSETEGEVGAVNMLKSPSNSLLIVPRRKFCCGSLLHVFGVRVSVAFHLMCVHIIFGSVLVAEWTSFGKKLLKWLTIFSLCILTNGNFNYFPFWF